MTGNERKLYESAENYFVKLPQMNLFLADFSHLKSLGPTAEVKLTYTHSAARITETQRLKSQSRINFWDVDLKAEFFVEMMVE